MGELRKPSSHLVATTACTLLIRLHQPPWALIVPKIRCPECGSECILDDKTFEWICPNCGLVVDDSRMAHDDYHNIVFMDDYRGRVEHELKRRLRRQWREASDIEHRTRGGTNYVVELVRSKLKELMPAYRELLDQAEAHSLKELFKHFLFITGLPYEEARDRFLKACRKAQVKPPKLRPVKVLTPSASRARLRIRNARIRKALDEVRDLKIRKLVEALMDIPEYQPVNIKALIAAVGFWLNGRILVRDYSDRAFRRYLKLLKRFSRMNAYVLTKRYGLKPEHIALLKKISLHGVQESIRRGRLLMHTINENSGSNLVVASNLYPELGETHLKVIAHYKRYPDYVRACQALGLKTLDKKEWRRVKADLELLGNETLDGFLSLHPTWEVEYEFNLIAPYQYLTDPEAYDDVFSIKN